MGFTIKWMWPSILSQKKEAGKDNIPWVLNISIRLSTQCVQTSIILTEIYLAVSYHTLCANSQDRLLYYFVYQSLFLFEGKTCL